MRKVERGKARERERKILAVMFFTALLEAGRSPRFSSKTSFASRSLNGQIFIGLTFLPMTGDERSWVTVVIGHCLLSLYHIRATIWLREREQQYRHSKKKKWINTTTHQWPRHLLPSSSPVINLSIERRYHRRWEGILSCAMHKSFTWQPWSFSVFAEILSVPSSFVRNHWGKW